MFDGQFTLGPFSVDPEGGLQPSAPDRFPAFSLYWRQRRVRVGLVSGNGQPGSEDTLAMQVELGRVPSTAGGDREQRIAQRARSFALLTGLRANVPPGWNVSLLADHRVLLDCRETLVLPTTAVVLVTDVTTFLLTLDPYIDLFDEAGLGQEAAAGIGAPMN